MIGHGEQFCDRIFDSPIEKIEKPYGVWLRADPRRKMHTMGSKWLRNGGDFQARNSGEKSGMAPDKPIPEKSDQAQQYSMKSGADGLAIIGDKGEIQGTIQGNKERSNQSEIYQFQVQNFGGRK